MNLKNKSCLIAVAAMAAALNARAAEFGRRPPALTTHLPAPLAPALPGLAAGSTRPQGAVPGTGAPTLDVGLRRVSEAVAEMAAPGAGSDSGSREGARRVEQAMTGERGIKGVDPVDPAVVDRDAARQVEVTQAKGTLDKILAEVDKVIVGQKDMKRAILMTLVARQHVLLEGLPGVAKTETAKAFADAVEGAFQRVQGTPDKLPSDILGAEILQEDPATGKKDFQLSKGPVFTNILLVDEINRMPPKAQAALLEAMSEGRVTIGRQTIDLNRFTMLATQNPVEQDGTYRLPEAQLDRFMFKALVPQPSAAELMEILRLNRSKESRPRAAKVTNLEELDNIRRLAESLVMTEDVESYIVRVAMAASSPDMKKMVNYTVYTRAAIYLAQAARIHALMDGRIFVKPSDVRAIAPQVLRHRITLDFQAKNMTVEAVILNILDRVQTYARPK